MTARPAGVIVRGLVLAFCWATTLYAFVASSAFAYLQFIKPRVFAWVGTFSDWHAVAAWVWLALLVTTAWPERRLTSPARYAAKALLVFAAGAVAWNTIAPVMPTLHDGPRSIVVGLIALVPILWLGGIDHMVSSRYLSAQRGATSEGEHRARDGRSLVAAVGAAVLLTTVYAVMASMSISGAFEPDLLSAGLVRGVATSLIGHLLVFSAVFIVLAVSARLAGGSIVGQYVVLLAMAVLVLAGLFTRLVGEPIGMSGAWGRLAAACMAASIATAWGGMRLRGHADANATCSSGADVFLRPPRPGDAPGRLALALAVVLPLAWSLAWAAGHIDWDFVLLKTGVVFVWFVAFALLYGAAPLRAVPTLAIALACGLPLVVHATWRHSELQQHALVRYSVHNPSYLFVDGLLRERQGRSLFDRFLLANTGLTDVTVKPVAIDHVLALPPAHDRPHIFLFVVDSLRADYLSPYNPEVAFTPRIAEFAETNLLFPNAFTRYGGTGLSMPAIWAGAALAHKQYVLPFAPMNGLEKLLDANGYRRIQGRDHITEALWSPAPGDVELDRGRNEMAFDFCRTLEELVVVLQGGAAREGPIFAQTRSLNLHVAEVRNGYVPPGKSYPGFEAPYAYRVERIDGCFGQFIDQLKALQLYEQSLIVLTADHGELIGEDGRWGHSYHMFPEVIQVPLFMHLPRDVRAQQPDRGAVAMSTDITPTVYSVLGYTPVGGQALRGRSLLDEASAARRGSQVLAASYGAVYAALSRNGRRLYIADAIQGRDHAYTRATSGDLRWAEVPVDAGTRVVGQLRIRRHIDEVGRTYGIDRPF